MSDAPRDWDRELAKIDQIMAKGGAATPTPTAGGGSSGVPSAARDRGQVGPGRLAIVTTWIRVVLGLLLAVGITQWPYPAACGLNLAVYLGAIATVIVAGLWSATSSWSRRLGLAHTLSLLVLLWGLTLLARELLPRTGYARETRPWACSAPVGIE
jgi:hypothetical protein